jgi:hypothetical protein
VHACELVLFACSSVRQPDVLAFLHFGSRCVLSETSLFAARKILTPAGRSLSVAARMGFSVALVRVQDHSFLCEIASWTCSESSEDRVLRVLRIRCIL